MQEILDLVKKYPNCTISFNSKRENDSKGNPIVTVAACDGTGKRYFVDVPMDSYTDEYNTERLSVNLQWIFTGMSANLSTKRKAPTMGRRGWGLREYLCNTSHCFWCGCLH